MRIDRTKINIALKVLRLASKQLRSIKGYGMSAWVHSYANCREQGLHLHVSFGGLSGVAFSFAENRNSDDIVVYWGPIWKKKKDVEPTTESNTLGKAFDNYEPEPFNNQTNIPSEETYRNRRAFFPWKREDQAAAFIVQVVREQYRVWLEDGGEEKIKEWKRMARQRKKENGCRVVKS